jgi:hypothetical protein
MPTRTWGIVEAVAGASPGGRAAPSVGEFRKGSCIPTVVGASRPGCLSCVVACSRSSSPGAIPGDAGEEQRSLNYAAAFSYCNSGAEKGHVVACINMP